MTAGQLLVATLVSDFYAFLAITTGPESWVAAVRRLLELIKTEATGCSVCVALRLFAGVAKMVRLLLALGAEVIRAVGTAYTALSHMLGCLL